MRRSDRGSVSVVFATVMVPFLILMLLVAVDISQFYGVREEVRRILDTESRESLSRARAGDIVSARVRQHLSGTDGFIHIDDVWFSGGGASGEVSLRGSYRGLFGELAGYLIPGNSFGIPFEVTTTARRFNTDTLVILDRTVPSGSDPCNEPGLQRRAVLAGRVASGLLSRGASRVTVAVVPGAVDPIEMLLAVDGADPVPRCSLTGTRLPFNVGSVQGVVESGGDSVSVAYGATQLLLRGGTTSPVEKRAVVMIVPPEIARAQYVGDTLALLDAEANQQRFSLGVTALAVGGSAGQDAFQTIRRLSNGRAAYVTASDTQAESAELAFAVVSSVQGQTVVSR